MNTKYQISSFKFQRSVNAYCKGYTLLETLVAMALFIIVIVPLMEYISVSNKINRGEEKIIASCILEQEAAALKMFPDEILVTKFRKVKGEKWLIKTSLKGEKLKMCRIGAYKKDKKIGEVFLYVYEGR